MTSHLDKEIYMIVDRFKLEDVTRDDIIAAIMKSPLYVRLTSSLDPGRLKDLGHL